MPTTDLSLVTETLHRIVRNGVNTQLTTAPVLLTSMAPESLAGRSNTINLHLFHVAESAADRNVVSPGIGPTPVARTPLALSLFYVLTAHHDTATDGDWAGEQLLFGLAAKALHDHPVIDDGVAMLTTAGHLEPVLPVGLRGRENRFEIILRPLSPEESSSYWSAEHVLTTRLTAFYEVRSVLLEPEPAQQYAGTVFDLGVDIDVGLPPQLLRSGSTTVVAPPASTGLQRRELYSSPAAARLVAPAADPKGTARRVSLSGSGFTGARGPAGTRLVLRCQRWRDADPPIERVVVDNDDWAVTARDDHVEFLVAPTVGPVGAAHEILPGIYDASLEVDRNVGPTETRSIPIAIGPWIELIELVAGDGTLRIRVDASADPALARDVQLIVGGEAYHRRTDGGPLQAGEFAVVGQDVVAAPMFDLDPPAIVPIRLFVDGAPAQPAWLEVP